MDLGSATQEQLQSESVDRGVESFIGDYAHVTETDHVVVLYTPECREPAARLVIESRRRGATSYPFGMRPLQDADFEHRLIEFLPAQLTTVQRLVVISIERDTMSHVLPLRRILSRYNADQVSVFRIISGCDEFFTHAVNLTSDELSSINSGLLHRLMPASSVRIKSTGGSDLEVRLDSDRYRWLSNRGVWRAGAFIVFPPGEIATFPADINGVLVADGAFNVTAYTELDARLADHPVTIKVERGKMVDYSCADARVKELITRCLRYDNADIVGELGIGTNSGIPSFIRMNSHINERRPGLHLGFGQHAQKRSVVEYRCDVHLDLITADAHFDLDDGGQPLDSRLFTPSDLPHPSNVDDEDIDGDCCGLFTFN